MQIKWNSALVIAATALLLRLAVGAALSLPHAQTRDASAGFGKELGGIARSVAAGEGFSSPYAVRTGPTAFKAPVYPYLMAGVFELFGTYSYGSLLVLLALNCLFAGLTCLVVYFIGESEFGPAIAARAAWLWALLPQAAYVATGKVWDASLGALLLCLVFWMALRLRDQPRRSLWIAFGLLAAFAALSNPVVLAPLPFLGVWLLHQYRRQGAAHGSAVIWALAIFLLAIAPWLARNYAVFGEFIFIRSDFGLELLVGNSGEESAPRNMQLHPSENPAEAALMQRMGEAPYMRAKQRQALATIAAHPAAFVGHTLSRMAGFWTGIWSLRPAYLRKHPFDLIHVGLATGLSLLAFLGLRRMSGVARKSRLGWGIVLAAYPLVYYVTHPGFRYRHLLDPLLVILAAVALGGSGAVRPSRDPAIFAAGEQPAPTAVA